MLCKRPAISLSHYIGAADFLLEHAVRNETVAIAAKQKKGDKEIRGQPGCRLTAADKTLPIHQFIEFVANLWSFDSN